MDNVTHTLAGLALAEAGLNRKTAWATATLAIGANLPDVDVIARLAGSGVDGLAFRRGWTHGVLAMLVLPPLLAASVIAWSRARRRPPSQTGAAPVRPGWLLVLAALGVWSHPLLDLVNTYGVRLLMPFSNRWFYGDTLFIVDPWVLVTLGAGVFVSRARADRAARASGVRPHDNAPAGGDGRRSTRPARIVLAACAAYVLAMAASARVGRAVVDARSDSGRGPRTMVAPLPVTPVRRAVVRDLGSSYEIGVLSWGWPPRYSTRGLVPVGRDAPGVAAAARTRDGAAFLSWSRFPRFAAERAGDSIRVRMSDVRYADARGRGWASVVVTVPAPPDVAPTVPAARAARAARAAGDGHDGS